MIHTELISTTKLDDKFHQYVEQLTGINPASVVQGGRRPKSNLAYVLAYYKAFFDHTGDMSDVRGLMGLIHFGLLSAGPGPDMVEIVGWCHGLTCLSSPSVKHGVMSAIFTGDGDQWVTAIRNAGQANLESVKDWGISCYRQFATQNLSDLFGTLRPQSGDQYLLES